MTEEPGRLDISDEMIAERRGGSGKMPEDMPTWMSKTIVGIDRFSKQIGKLIVVTRGKNGASAISGNEIVECEIQKNLKIVDLTGAGDLFAAGFLHGYVNNLSRIIQKRLDRC